MLVGEIDNRVGIGACFVGPRREMYPNIAESNVRFWEGDGPPH